jgi:hypothetical protein
MLFVRSGEFLIEMAKFQCERDIQESQVCLTCSGWYQSLKSWFLMTSLLSRPSSRKYPGDERPVPIGLRSFWACQLSEDDRGTKPTQDFQIEASVPLNDRARETLRPIKSISWYRRSKKFPLSCPISKLRQWNYYYLEEHQCPIIYTETVSGKLLHETGKKIILINMNSTSPHLTRWKNRSKDSLSNSSFSKVLARRQFTGNWPQFSLLQLTR